MKHPKYDLILAAISGEQMQYETDGDWFNCTADSAMYFIATDECEVRIKPKTIRIGDVEVPSPVTEPLEMDEQYWYWTLSAFGGVSWTSWENDQADNNRLNRRLIHLTEAAARANMEAVIKLLGGEV